jgi:hypothetical protein
MRRGAFRSALALHGLTPLSDCANDLLRFGAPFAVRVVEVLRRDVMASLVPGGAVRTGASPGNEKALATAVNAVD